MPYQFSFRQKANNFVVFQAMWFSCVFAPSWAVVIVGLGLVAWLYQVEPWSRERLTQTSVFFGTGLFMDVVLAFLGVHQFVENAYLIPVWYPFLWLIFASTMTLSLSWVLNNTVLAVVAGSFFGPLSYFAAAQLNVLNPYAALDIAFISLAWGAYMGAASLFMKRHHYDCPFSGANQNTKPKTLQRENFASRDDG